MMSAKDLVAALANRKISAVELVEETISRIESYDNEINAVVVRDFARARASAKAADKAIAQNVRLPLLGLPITVKEAFNVAGLPTTWGNILYKDWYPQNDALSIARLKQAGAIIIGKTNVPFMLHDWQTYNEIYGTTNNPRNLHFTPGGSSGGSAAALAAGFTSLELGSDIAGSIRVPASYCGVFGHKPSTGLVPMRGAGPPMSLLTPNPPTDFVVAGPMARTADDLALALEVLAGPDELWDGKGHRLALPSPRYHDIDRFRVLILDTHPLCPTAEVVNKSFEHLVQRLIKLGVTVSDEMQGIDLAEITRTYVTLLAAFAGGSFPIEKYNRVKEEAKILKADDASISAYMLRGYTVTHRDWLIAMRKRKELRQHFRKLFQKFDVIICPVMPTPAFPHDHSDHEKRQININGSFFPYHDQFAWVSIATIFGLPATVMPIDYTTEGLPIGVQIIGDYLEDYTTIEFAKKACLKKLLDLNLKTVVADNFSV